MSNSVTALSKISEALISFYPTNKEKAFLLDQVGKLTQFLEKHEDVMEFFSDYGLAREQKKEVLLVLGKILGNDEILENTLCLLVDRHLIFHISLFLKMIKKSVYRFLNIQDIFVYSSYPMTTDQKNRLEAAWNKKFRQECIYHYSVDKTLGLGIKVQADTYIEEFSLSSQLSNLKLKLDSIFG